MSRPICCEVSIAALQHNLRVAKKLSGPRKTWAVIKANAYGHGTAAAVAGFAEADGLAMLDFDDAVLCRQLGWRQPILMLEGPFHPNDLKIAQQLDLELVVHNERQIQWFEGASGPAIVTHLKINTGMNRLGFAPSTAKAMAQRLQESGRCASLVWVTHFANAELAPIGQGYVSTERQFAALAPLADVNRASVMNSAAVLQQIQPHPFGEIQTYGWARPGIMLYGASPFADRSAQMLGLLPAMTLRSELIAVQAVEAGGQIGYGSSFTAETAMTIGIVACGYADGYPRIARAGTPIAVGGITTRVVGRVSMDMLNVDLAPVVKAGLRPEPGMSVELWGPQVPVDEVAAGAQTVGYELLCGIAPRVKRIIR